MDRVPFECSSLEGRTEAPDTSPRIWAEEKPTRYLILQTDRSGASLEATWDTSRIILQRRGFDEFLFQLTIVS